MTDSDILNLGLLLLVACLVAIATRRAGFPYAIGLVAAGVGLALTGLSSPLTLTRELIFSVLLPPLVFEGALHLSWRQFRCEAPLVLSIAFGGTLLSAGVVAGGMHALVGWGWQAAALFGALIAATDPVSVLAMMKEQHAPRRLRFLMEAESLVNDGAAAVLFALALAWIEGRATGTGGALAAFVMIAGGGVAIGLGVAAALLSLAGRVDDHLVETTLTVLAAYGSFLIAERFHASGVLATLSAGMLVGNWGRGRWLSEHGSDAMIRLWEFGSFLANSIVFLLIGTKVATQAFATNLMPALIGTGLVLAGRMIAVYPVAAVFGRGRLRVPPPFQHVLFWGGLRGALALALALGAPASLPERGSLIVVAFAVVAFSIFVQGLTVPRLLRTAARETTR